jgi:hypothetical protein
MDIPQPLESLEKQMDNLTVKTGLDNLKDIEAFLDHYPKPRDLAARIYFDTDSDDTDDMVVPIYTDDETLEELKAKIPTSPPKIIKAKLAELAVLELDRAHYKFCDFMVTYCEWCHRTVGCLADHEKTRDHLRVQMVRLDKIKVRDPRIYAKLVKSESKLLARIIKFKESLGPKRCTVCERDVVNLNQHKRTKRHRDLLAKLEPSV